MIGDATTTTVLLDLLARLGHIAYFIVMPILLLAATGFLLQRKLGLDMETLRRLNFYFVLPAIVYFSVVSSRVGLGRLATAVLFAAMLFAGMGVLTYLIALARRVPADQRSAMVMTTIMFNSGNYGLPLQRFAFRPDNLSDAAAALQAFVMLTQNVLTFTVGIVVAAGGRSRQSWKANLLHIAKFPPIYALAAGLLTVQLRSALGGAAAGVGEALRPFMDFVAAVKDAFVAVALLTLGAQLALVRRGPSRYPVRLSVLLRLLVAPAAALGIIYAFGITALLAQVLLIASAAPTAVNCLLLCMEFDNHPDYAARAVLYSTLLSPVTVTLVIFLARANLLPGFGL
jgi:hypothetical protein